MKDNRYYRNNRNDSGDYDDYYEYDRDAYDTGDEVYDDYEDFDYDYDREDDRYGERRTQRSTRASVRGRSAAGESRRRKTSSGKKARPQAKRSSSGKRTSGKNKRKKKQSSAAPVLLIVLLIIIMGAAFGGKIFLDKYSYSKERADLNSYFATDTAPGIPIVWNDEISEVRAKEIDGAYYLSLADVKSRLNNRFYYGVQNSSDETGMILYALPEQMVRTDVGSNEIFIGENASDTAYKPAVRDGDTIYLALDFVRQYTNFSYEAFDEPTRLVITSSWGEKTVAKAAKNTAIRTTGGIKSPVLEDLSKDSSVTVLEQMETWSKVVSGDGIIGYVENKRLKDISAQQMTPVADYTEPDYKSVRIDGKVNMAFHNVWGSQGNVTLSSYMASTKSVNVVAPTWYWINDNFGNMDKACTLDYVNTAHNMGLQVWAVVDNFNSSQLPDHSEFLRSLDSRTNVIDQLISEQKTYDFDGINVDFEQVDSSAGEDYIQFIRELSIACRENGIILSVDDYPSYEYNDYYNIGEQGVFADYVVIMGYDEHYAGSQEAGSVASLSYVTDGISMAIDKGVPKNKLVNAIPFYSRIWWTDNGAVKSESHGMQEIEDYIAAHSMETSWNAEAGQNYAQTTEGSTLIQIWVEDAQSVKAKLDVMQSYDIAGVAEWRLQFETADVWDVISNYMAQ